MTQVEWMPEKPCTLCSQLLKPNKDFCEKNCIFQCFYEHEIQAQKKLLEYLKTHYSQLSCDGNTEEHSINYIPVWWIATMLKQLEEQK